MKDKSADLTRDPTEAFRPKGEGITHKEWPIV